MVLSEDGKPVEEAVGDSRESAGAESDEAAGVDTAGSNELDQVKEELRNTQDKLLRMAADFDNQKKRLLRDKDIALKYAEENLLKEILPSVDNLERALNQDQNGVDFGSQLLEGVQLTLKGLLNSLERYEVKAVSCVGEPFNPNFHEALAMEASKEVPEQRVLLEFEKGYLYKDKLLRAAKVVVSKGDVGS